MLEIILFHCFCCSRHVLQQAWHSWFHSVPAGPHVRSQRLCGTCVQCSAQIPSTHRLLERSSLTMCLLVCIPPFHHPLFWSCLFLTEMVEGWSVVLPFLFHVLHYVTVFLLYSYFTLPEFNFPDLTLSCAFLSCSYMMSSYHWESNCHRFICCVW